MDEPLDWRYVLLIVAIAAFFLAMKACGVV